MDIAVLQENPEIPASLEMKDLLELPETPVLTVRQGLSVIKDLKVTHQHFATNKIIIFYGLQDPRGKPDHQV